MWKFLGGTPDACEVSQYNGSPSKNPDIKTPLVAKNEQLSAKKKLTTSGILMSAFFAWLPLQWM